jgi:ketosteroid isomerase-like protein
MSEQLTARELGQASRDAVGRGDKEGWLEIFAPDAIVQDPIGPSPFDPEGKGHHGREAIGKFYDEVIASSEKITFEIQSSTLCGNECADVGLIRTWLAGGTHVAIVHCVFTYKSNGKNQLASLRAYWEFDKTQLVEASEIN